MSNPLSAPKNASPLVRSRSEATHDSRHAGPSIPRPPLPAERTSPAFAPPYIRAKTTSSPHSTSGASPFDPPQLSERESIFATHYLASDSTATTPRLGPVLTSRNNPNRDDFTDLNVAPSFSLPPAAPIQQQQQPSAIKIKSALSQHFNQPPSPHATAGNSSLHRGDRKLATSGIRTPTSPTSLRLTTQTPTTALDLARSNQGRPPPPYPLRMSTTWSHLELVSPATPKRTDSLNGQRDDKSTGGKFKDSSATGIAEQQIEATLGNKEPLANARSRKASHYLGIFKPNATLQDLKKAKEKTQEGIETSQPSEASESKGNESLKSTTPLLPVAADNFGKANTNDQVQASNDLPKTLITRTNLEREPEAIGLSQIREPSEKESIEWRSGRSSKGTLPLRLLEEIRNHHSGLSNSNRGDRKVPAKEASRQNIESEISGLASLNNAANKTHFQQDDNPSNGKPEDEEGDEEEYESDKEHISSATYYPHQAPSPDALGATGHRVLESTSADTEILAPLVPQTLRLDVTGDEVIPESGTLALTLQSKDKVHYIQQEYQRPLSQSDHGEVPKSNWSTASSTSDTDYESHDDSYRSERGYESMTDAGNLTPTATPKPQDYQARPHSHRAPLGAVELKPYKHQVGGHTKVFSFSKQAICKQLNNRENEFYEVIERRNPELLKFMPRYVFNGMASYPVSMLKIPSHYAIHPNSGLSGHTPTLPKLTLPRRYLGVLNVTYRKAPRRLKRKSRQNHDLTNRVTLGNAHEVSKENAPEQAEQQERPSSTPPPRTISHSQHYEAQDETVPQVIYANNMHIIPNNLFSLSPRLSDVGRPNTSSGIITVPPNSNAPRGVGDGIDARSAVPDDLKRPPLHKSHPSWGATTVNTKFKEKVLREVFSPANVYHHHRHGRSRRSRNNFRSLRGLSPERTNSSVDLSLTTTRLSNLSHEDTNGHDSDPTTAERGLPLSKNEQQKSASGSAPPSRLTESTLAMLDSASVQRTSPAPDRRSIQRRRSAGGLRRKQIGLDIDTSHRSDFEYYEDDGYGGDKEDGIFAMELGGSQIAPPTPPFNPGERPGKRAASEVEPVERNSIDSFYPTPKGSLTIADIANLQPSLMQAPVNPVEAQQQSDERVQHFLLLEDLTANMVHPCVLDLKMGTRQYGIEATKKKQMSQRQKCRNTTSRQLGVRVCGMQVWSSKKEEYNFEDKYAGRDIQAGREFQNALKRFLSDDKSSVSVLRHIPILLDKLSKLENIIVNLPGYRFYASSLLMLYDGGVEATLAPPEQSQKSARDPRSELPPSNIDIKLVDFANCVTGEDKIPDGTPCPPKDSNGVDRGYIRGLRSLRTYLQGIWKELNREEGWVERGEGEAMGPSKGAGRKSNQPEAWKENVDDDDGEVSV